MILSRADLDARFDYAMARWSWWQSNGIGGAIVLKISAIIALAMARPIAGIIFMCCGTGLFGFAMARCQVWKERARKCLIERGVDPDELSP